MSGESSVFFESRVDQIVPLKRCDFSLPITRWLEIIESTRNMELRDSVKNNILDVKEALSRLEAEILRDARFTFDTAMLSFGKGDLRSAHILLQSAIEDLVKFEANDLPLLKEAYLYHGIVLTMRGVRYYEEALGSFDELLKLDPTHIEGMKHRKSIRNRCGWRDELSPSVG